MLTRIRRFRARHLALMAIGAVTAMALTGTAMAITDTEFTYTTAKTGYVAIHPMDLAPDGTVSGTDYINVFFTAEVSTGLTAACFSTGVNLPQGARIKSIDTWYRSNDQSDPRTLLYRNNLATDVTDQLVFAEINDDTNVRKVDTRTVPMNLREVQNRTYTYGYGTCVGEGTTFEGARITYTYTSAGD